LPLLKSYGTKSLVNKDMSTAPLTNTTETTGVNLIAREVPVQFWNYLKWIELIALSLVGASQLFLLPVVEKLQPPISNMTSTFLIGLLAILVSVAPIPSSSLMRGLLVTVELSLLTVASMFGVTRLFNVLYMIVVARAGLLLRTRGIVVAICLAIVLLVLSKEFRYALTEPAVFSMTPLQHTVHVLVYGRVVNFVFNLIVSAMCTIALLRERDSRLERERLNAEVESMATKVERTRVAREIHDSVGHNLTALCMQLEFAEKCLVKQPAKVPATLDQIKSVAGQARRELQAALRPPDQTDIDLRYEITRLVEHYRSQGLFETIVDLEVPPLPAKTRHELFFLVKECLNNTAKYAKANSVSLAVNHSDENVTITIADDGMGFLPEEAQSKSFGMRGMQERANLIHGKLTIESTPGSGTRIVITAPRIIEDAT